MRPDELDLHAALSDLVAVLDHRKGPNGLIDAASHLFEFTYAFCVVNPQGAAPVYLCDTYPDGTAKQAVQLYVSRTYMLNPIYNELQNGLPAGLYLMADHAPDNWNGLQASAGVLLERAEEIGFRTPGWPTGLQEASLIVDLGDGAKGEVSFSHPKDAGGIPTDQIERLRPVLPLFDHAFRTLWARLDKKPDSAPEARATLGGFGAEVLTPREASIVQLVLKGHSTTSIGLQLEIAIPTVKTHRKNAYAKLGISTQQELFAKFLNWSLGE